MPRQVEVGGDVDADQALAEREPVEALDRGRAAPEAGRGEARVEAAAAACACGEVAQRRRPGPSAQSPPCRRRAAKSGEVAAIGADRRGGEAALDAQERQVRARRPRRAADDRPAAPPRRRRARPGTADRGARSRRRPRQPAARRASSPRREAERRRLAAAALTGSAAEHRGELDDPALAVEAARSR